MMKIHRRIDEIVEDKATAERSAVVHVHVQGAVFR